MTTQTQDVRMPVARDSATGKNTSPKFDEGRNFCNKLWQVATGFALAKLSQPSSDERPRPIRELRLIDRWMLSRLESSLQQINAAIQGYEFSDYAESVYRLLWWDFCDWYVEGVKPTIAADGMQRAVLAHALETIVRALHPIAPFVTEAVWERLQDIETMPVPGIRLGESRKGGLLATAGWPEIDASLRDEEAEIEFAEVRTLVEAIREVRARLNVPPKRKVTLHGRPEIDASARRAGGLVETLAVVDRITSESPPPGAAAFTVGAATCHLSSLADAVDAGAERSRLEKVITDNERSIKTLEGRLANPGYTEKAPPAMVQQTRDQLAKACAERDAAAAALRSLG
jgi:valyl-tRNA synthetase